MMTNQMDNDMETGITCVCVYMYVDIYSYMYIFGVVRSSRDTIPTGSPAAEEILILGSIFRPLFKLCHLFQRRRERERGRRIEEEKETVPSREGRCHGVEPRRAPSRDACGI